MVSFTLENLPNKRGKEQFYSVDLVSLSIISLCMFIYIDLHRLHIFQYKYSLKNVIVFVIMSKINARYVSLMRPKRFIALCLNLLYMFRSKKSD